MKFPWARGDENADAFKALDNDAGFLLDVKGRKVVALKLPGNVAREVAGQASLTSGVLARVAKLWRPAEAEQWLIVANMQNGLMNDYDTFATIVAQRLTDASGVTVPVSNLIIARSKVAAITGEQTAGPQLPSRDT